MRIRFVLCAALALLALLPTVGSAGERPFKIGFGGGTSVPMSDTKDAFKNGYHGRAMFMWNGPGLPVGLRGALGYEKLDLKSLSPGTSGDATILSGLGNITLGFPVGPIKPYILAGVGAFNTKTQSSGSTASPSKTQFGIDGGAGVELKFGAISAFLEGRMENIYTDKGFSTALGSAKEFKTQIIPVTFGVFF